jgi:hypothetical protein
MCLSWNHKSHPLTAFSSVHISTRDTKLIDLGTSENDANNGGSEVVIPQKLRHGKRSDNLEMEFMPALRMELGPASGDVDGVYFSPGEPGDGVAAGGTRRLS